MARKRRIFFRDLQPFLKSGRRSGWITQPLLALITAFLCIVVSPVFAKAPAVNSVVPSLPSSSLQTENLVQQGKTLYEAGQFAAAVKVLQQAVAAFKATGDELRQAMTLSNLSLAYEQLGLWFEAEQAIASSLSLLGYPVKQGRGAGEQGGNPKSRNPRPISRRSRSPAIGTGTSGISPDHLATVI